MADSAAASLSLNERKALLGLAKATGELSALSVMQRGGLGSVPEATSALNWLSSKGLVQAQEIPRDEVQIEAEGRDYAERGFPERRVVDELQRRGGRAAVADLVSNGVIAPAEVQIALAWLRKRGWAGISKEGSETLLTLTAKGREAVDSDQPDEILVRRLRKEEKVQRTSLEDDSGISLLLQRKAVVRVVARKDRAYSLTPAGRQVVESGLTLDDEIVELTRDDIVSRKWEKTTVRPFDATTVVRPTHGGRPHPLVLLIEKIRDIFVQLGFQEIEGPFVESAFWNMDTLFIPQDHPAREMQDTFYLDNPASIPVPSKLLKTVKDVQLTGGKTSSTGWGGSWSDDESKRALLRTHTTVTTIRYLSENPRPPAKVFGIGRVFRKEAIDATHLPEFHQVEGIVVEEGANFRMLQGLLGEFYKRMGFPQIKFRPSYYPYTEPSLDVAVKWGDRWLELGGAGIFRPEVTEPLGVPCPVLAWGLGLERLAMLTFKLTDIRQLYLSDVDWLRKAPIVLPEPGEESRTNHGEPGGGEP